MLQTATILAILMCIFIGIEITFLLGVLIIITGVMNKAPFLLVFLVIPVIAYYLRRLFK